MFIYVRTSLFCACFLSPPSSGFSSLPRSLSVRHVNVYAHQTAYPVHFFFFCYVQQPFLLIIYKGCYDLSNTLFPISRLRFVCSFLTSSLFLLLVYIVQVLFVLSSLYLLLFSSLCSSLKRKRIEKTLR